MRTHLDNNTMQLVVSTRANQEKKEQLIHKNDELMQFLNLSVKSLERMSATKEILNLNNSTGLLRTIIIHLNALQNKILVDITANELSAYLGIYKEYLQAIEIVYSNYHNYFKKSHFLPKSDYACAFYHTLTIKMLTRASAFFRDLPTDITEHIARLTIPASIPKTHVTYICRYSFYPNASQNEPQPKKQSCRCNLI